MGIKGGVNPNIWSNYIDHNSVMLHPMTLILVLKCCSLNELSFGMLTL